MRLTGLAEIVKAAGMAMTGKLEYDFQRGCASPISAKIPAHGINHERGLHFLGRSGSVSGFCVVGGMFIYPYALFARLAGSTWSIFSDMGQHEAEAKAYKV